jgi:hypothetical protein
MGSKRGFCGLLAHFAESLLPHSTKVGFTPRLFGGSAENTLTDYQLCSHLLRTIRGSTRLLC